MGARLLIVDDHAGFRCAARELLQAQGWQVCGEAATLAEAQRLQGLLRPDVVLLDVSLPDGNGFDAAPSIVESGAHVVLISSRDWSGLAARLATSRARGFLRKENLSGRSLEALLP